MNRRVVRTIRIVRNVRLALVIANDLYYVNPDDPAMWVENRFGLGYTLNFGNWRAWLLIISMMLFPLFAGRLLF